MLDPSTKKTGDSVFLVFVTPVFAGVDEYKVIRSTSKSIYTKNKVFGQREIHKLCATEKEARFKLHDILLGARKKSGKDFNLKPFYDRNLERIGELR
jgi:hypothetical protein